MRFVKVPLGMLQNALDLLRDSYENAHPELKPIIKSACFSIQNLDFDLSMADFHDGPDSVAPDDGGTSGS